MKATEQELDSCNLNANEVNEEDVNDKKEMSESENSSQESSQVNKTKRGPLSLSHSSPDDPKTCTYMQNGFIDCPLSTALNVWALWGQSKVYPPAMEKKCVKGKNGEITTEKLYQKVIVFKYFISVICKSVCRMLSF